MDLSTYIEKIVCITGLIKSGQSIICRGQHGKTGIETYKFIVRNSSSTWTANYDMI